VLAKVQGAVEVIVEQDHRAVALIKTPQAPRRKTSECIALAVAYEERLDYAPQIDAYAGLHASFDKARYRRSSAFIGGHFRKTDFDRR
jgi:hypothetical protein